MTPPKIESGAHFTFVSREADRDRVSAHEKQRRGFCQVPIRAIAGIDHARDS
jgi:hypothetical protein